MDDTANGTIRRMDDGRYEVVFVRRLRKPIEKVWAALTVTERLADWFTEVRFTPEPRLGAAVSLSFPDDDPPYEMTGGEVIAFDPPRLFAWTWPESPDNTLVIRCKLAPDGDGCVLTFSESGAVGKHVTWGAAGWHIFLGGLEGATEGLRTPGSIEREKALRPLYQAQVEALA
jgi:uncharacterized protein YndB with AHSA1/START domain